MIGAFNTAISALQGFFSKLFWFGTFLPVALFAALHLAIAAVTFDSVHAAVTAPITGDGWWPVAILGLVVLAFAVSPLLPLLRGMMDGSLLPEAIREALRRSRAAEVSRRRGRLRREIQTLGSLADLARGGHDQAAEASKAGTARCEAKAPAEVAKAEAAIGAARAVLARGDLPDERQVEAAIASACAALRANCSDPSIVPDDQKALARRTDAMTIGLDALLTDTETEARGRLANLMEQQRGVPDDIAIQPTRMGDARWAAERYPDDVYAVPFDFLWPRLELLIPADDTELSARLLTAQAQLNFSVLAVALSATLFAWVPFLALHGTSVAAFLAVAVGAPALLWFSWLLAVESQFGIGRTLEVAIDRHRLKVLEALRMPQPMSREAERTLWQQLVRANEDHRTAPLFCTPPKPPA